MIGSASGVNNTFDRVSDYYGLNVGWIMFVRTLFVSLWSLLFIIPGIIKQYEYMMILGMRRSAASGRSAI